MHQMENWNFPQGLFALRLERDVFSLKWRNVTFYL